MNDEGFKAGLYTVRASDIRPNHVTPALHFKVSAKAVIQSCGFEKSNIDLDSRSHLDLAKNSGNERSWGEGS